MGMARRVYPQGPDHWAPMTWHKCIAPGCQVRLDPWEHRTRCPDHLVDAAAAAARVRELVEAARRG